MSDIPDSPAPVSLMKRIDEIERNQLTLMNYLSDRQDMGTWTDRSKLTERINNIRERLGDKG